MLFKVILIGGLVYLLYRTYLTKSLPEGQQSKGVQEGGNSHDEDFVDYEEVD